MRAWLSFRATTTALLTVLVVSYVLCVAAGLVFDRSTMYRAWLPLLPGFAWPPTVGGFLVGLLWVVGYSVYGAALIVLPYNYVVRREVAR
jgi:hypothetical protein